MLRECKVAEPEEAQEHANSTLALCVPNKTPGALANKPKVSRIHPARTRNPSP
jgi:hypothetical protein